MARVTGIGGVFIKSKNPKALLAWYRDTLGIPMEDWGTMFQFKDDLATGREGFSVFSVHDADTKYYDPSKREFMINLRVDDMKGMIAALKAKGVEIVGQNDTDPSGWFVWVMDPDGTKVELWEPKKA